MKKSEIILRIKELQKELEDAPYGKKVLNKKIFPPNINIYARTVDDLIDALITLHNIDNQIISLNAIQELQSIRNNEINRLFISHPKISASQIKSFYIDEELEKISNTIYMFIPKPLSYER